MLCVCVCLCLSAIVSTHTLCVWAALCGYLTSFALHQVCVCVYTCVSTSMCQCCTWLNWVCLLRDLLINQQLCPGAGVRDRERPTERQTGREKEGIKAGVCSQGAPSVLRWNAAAANFKDFLPLAWTLSPCRPGPPPAFPQKNNDKEREGDGEREWERETKCDDHNNSYISKTDQQTDMAAVTTHSTAYK